MAVGRRAVMRRDLRRARKHFARLRYGLRRVILPFVADGRPHDCPMAFVAAWYHLHNAEQAFIVGRLNL